MLGVIMCGGKSSRMGADKGLLTINAGTWAQTTADMLEALQIPVVISVSQNQLSNYGHTFAQEKMVADSQLISAKGPLCGILSVHQKYPAEDLFVLACDMPLMETAILKKLLIHYHKKLASAYAFNNSGSPEPLCAVYTAEALSHIFLLMETNQLASYSMKNILTQVNTLLIPLATGEEKYFTNFNSYDELKDL